jgi:hypothetical protein|tara:strand:+ start:6 stop:875 length:870 start_codon:yes stop_codon:yes gene_type:complete
MSNNSDDNSNKGYDDSYANQVNEIINTLELDSETDRSILKSRFLSEVIKYEDRKLHTKKYYDRFRFIVTVGSIILPAILSLGQMDPKKLPPNFDQIVYWSSWTISLMVTASNGFLQLFSLDKNYFEYALTTEQLKTEGWQYFQLSGKYEDDESHQAAYKDFSKSIENIKRKQVEKEFSGKGDVNKKKKEKPFDFQAELVKNLPDHLKPKPDPEKGEVKVDSKLSEIDDLMNDKMGKLDTLMTMLEKKNMDGDVASTVGNVREILSGSIKEQVQEAASEVVEEAIDKSIK